jgi:hypothetical protein
LKLKEIFLNKLGFLIDGDFKFGVLLLVFVRFLGGDTGNKLHRRSTQVIILHDFSTYIDLT